MTDIVWPKGKGSKTFVTKVRKHAELITTGRVLAIDPASGHSSMPGYALYEGGKLMEAGVMDIDKKRSASERLSQMYDCFKSDFPDNIDVLAIEHLRGGKVPNVLHWATGATVAAINAKVVLEVPIHFWKAIAKTKPDYIKQDDTDAILIGEVVIRLA